MGHKKFWKSFQIEMLEIKILNQDILKLLEEAHQIKSRSPRSRIQIYESENDELLRGWRLNSQSGSQEVVKKFSNWNARNSRFWTKMIENY